LKNYQTPVAVVNTPPSDSSQGNDDLLIDTFDDVSVLALSEYIHNKSNKLCKREPTIFSEYSKET
jgi:hypothetical protein